jgi:hypothetical protein
MLRKFMITSMLELLLDINHVMGVPTMLWDTKECGSASQQSGTHKFFFKRYENVRRWQVI